VSFWCEGEWPPNDPKTIVEKAYSLGWSMADENRRARVEAWWRPTKKNDLKAKATIEALQKNDDAMAAFMAGFYWCKHFYDTGRVRKTRLGGGGCVD
jgi:regulator of replication initiation timing